MAEQHIREILDPKRNEIDAVCQRWGIRRLDLFGPILRDDFDPARSDVDIVAYYQNEAPSQLNTVFDEREELQAIVGYPVDLLNYAQLLQHRNPYRRQSILESRRAYYEKRG
jgi:uncharacterized protein